MNAQAPSHVFSNSTIRKATFDDMPYMREIAEEMYHGRGHGGRSGWNWMGNCIKDPACFVWIGEASYIVARIYKQYGFELRCRVDMLCARPKKRAVLEALQLVKATCRWAALNGVDHPIKLDADTGVDFGAFARRLGGKPMDRDKYPVYEIPVNGGQL